MAYLRWRWLFTLAVSSTTCQSFDVNIHSTPRRSAGGTIASMHSSPHLRLPTHHLCCARRSTNTNSHLYLFDPLMQNQSARVNGRKRCPNHIPEEDLDFLRYFSENSDTPPFPYSIDLGDAQSYANTRLIVRHLEDEDIVKVLPEVVREFGALTAPPPSVDRVLADELSDKIENYLFSLTVLIGLTQRVVRRQKGYSPTNSACPDHNVVCLVELNTITRTEEIVGIAELSWQIPNPNGNAPPFVLPYFMKVLLSRLFSIINDDATSDTSPVGYISNVLVWKTRRGRGYARILMAGMFKHLGIPFVSK